MNTDRLAALLDDKIAALHGIHALLVTALHGDIDDLEAAILEVAGLVRYEIEDACIMREKARRAA